MYVSMVQVSMLYMIHGYILIYASMMHLSDVCTLSMMHVSMMHVSMMHVSMMHVCMMHISAIQVLFCIYC